MQATPIAVAAMKLLDFIIGFFLPLFNRGKGEAAVTLTFLER
jgi:hypothetical protein